MNSAYMYLIMISKYFPGRSRHNVVLPKIDNGRNHLAPLSKMSKHQSSITDNRFRKSSSRKATPLTLQLNYGGQMHQGGN